MEYRSCYLLVSLIMMVIGVGEGSRGNFFLGSLHWIISGIFVIAYEINGLVLSSKRKW